MQESFVRLVGNTPTEYSRSDLERDYPNTSFPDVIHPNELVAMGLEALDIDYSVYPANETEKIGPSEIVKVAGKWVKRDTVISKTVTELNNLVTTMVGRKFDNVDIASQAMIDTQANTRVMIDPTLSKAQAIAQMRQEFVDAVKTQLGI